MSVVCLFTGAAVTCSLWLAGGGGIVGPLGSTFLKSISDARSQKLWYYVGVNSLLPAPELEGHAVERSLSNRPSEDNTLSL